MMEKMTNLVCEVCGASASRSGKPFDGAGLAKHMRMVHGGGGGDSASAAFVCDICGVNQSSRGKPFTQWAHVLQHKKKRHPDALDGQDGPATPTEVAARPQHAGVRNRARSVATTAPRKANHVKFCPHCGFNLDVVHAAMEFINGEP